MLQNMMKTIRDAAMNDPAVFGIVQNRVYQQRVDLASDKNVYPLLVFTLASGFPDLDGYPVKEINLEAYYISETSVDEAIKLYEAFHDIINNERFGDPTNGFYHLMESSTPLDSSALFQDKLLYVYTNTYRVKAIKA